MNNITWTKDPKRECIEGTGPYGDEYLIIPTEDGRFRVQSGQLNHSIKRLTGNPATLELAKGLCERHSFHYEAGAAVWLEEFRNAKLKYEWQSQEYEGTEVARSLVLRVKVGEECFDFSFAVCRVFNDMLYARSNVSIEGCFLVHDGGEICIDEYLMVDNIPDFHTYQAAIEHFISERLMVSDSLTTPIRFIREPFEDAFVMYREEFGCGCVEFASEYEVKFVVAPDGKGTYNLLCDHDEKGLCIKYYLVASELDEHRSSWWWSMVRHIDGMKVKNILPG